jgi:hypothetical protein
MGTKFSLTSLTTSALLNGPDRSAANPAQHRSNGSSSTCQYMIGRRSSRASRCPSITDRTHGT